MKSSAKKIELASVDDLFSTEESRQDEQLEKIQEIPLSELHPFKDHPFKVKDDDAMIETADSIKKYGVLVPAIARPLPDGGYELVAGHRRRRASELAGKETMPVIVRDLDDDAATIIMVDSNLQRENLLPSERAFAYKMKLEAIKHQGARTDLTSVQVEQKLSARDQVAKEAGERSGMRRCDNMNTNDLNTALYEKMAAEQDKYRDWLKSQPPEEILNHTYEYTIREDIVMAMEELELTDAQAKALLESPSPLADVYRYFEKLETGYMDVIRDSIESRANEVCREPEELNPMVVYLHSASYATKHGETDAYWLSDQANFSCKVAIEQAISTHYGDNRLDTASAVQEVMEKFGPERMNFILANTIQHKDADGRISRDNKAWAKTIPMPEDKESFRRNAYLVVDQVNPGLVDLFTRQARKTVQEKEKGSVLQKLKQELPAHKPAAPKKQGPER